MSVDWLVATESNWSKKWNGIFSTLIKNNKNKPSQSSQYASNICLFIEQGEIILFIVQKAEYW